MLALINKSQIKQENIRIETQFQRNSIILN